MDGTNRSEAPARVYEEILERRLLRRQLNRAIVVFVLSGCLFGWLVYTLNDTFATRWNRRKVGMTPGEVRQLLGEPTATVESLRLEAPVFADLPQVAVWSYEFPTDDERGSIRYTVIFQADSAVKFIAPRGR